MDLSVIVNKKLNSSIKKLQLSRNLDNKLYPPVLLFWELFKLKLTSFSQIVIQNRIQHLSYLILSLILSLTPSKKKFSLLYQFSS